MHLLHEHTRVHSISKPYKQGYPVPCFSASSTHSGSRGRSGTKKKSTAASDISLRKHQAKNGPGARAGGAGGGKGGLYARTDNDQDDDDDDDGCHNSSFSCNLAPWSQTGYVKNKKGIDGRKQMGILPMDENNQLPYKILRAPEERC